MTTMADVKAGFYDAQRQASNMFEIIFADLAQAQAQAQAQQAKEGKTSIPSPVETLPVPA